MTSSRPIPNFYGRILDDFTALKQISDTQQREISDNVFFDWTQGQSNTSALPYGYDYHLKRIISMLESDLSTIAGKPIKVISLINQVSVYSTTSPLAQIQSIFDDEDIHF